MWNLKLALLITASAVSVAMCTEDSAPEEVLLGAGGQRSDRLLAETLDGQGQPSDRLLAETLDAEEQPSDGLLAVTLDGEGPSAGFRAADDVDHCTHYRRLALLARRTDTHLGRLDPHVSRTLRRLIDEILMEAGMETFGSLLELHDVCRRRHHPLPNN